MMHTRVDPCVALDYDDMLTPSGPPSPERQQTRHTAHTAATLEECVLLYYETPHRIRRFGHSAAGNPPPTILDRVQTSSLPRLGASAD